MSRAGAEAREVPGLRAHIEMGVCPACAVP